MKQAATLAELNSLNFPSDFCMFKLLHQVLNSIAMLDKAMFQTRASALYTSRVGAILLYGVGVPATT